MIVEYGAYGKRPTASNLIGNAQLSWFNTSSDITFQASLLDLGWCLLRMCPKKIFDVSVEATENQAVPGWTSFNMTTTTVDPETTKIGYVHFCLHLQQTLALCLPHLRIFRK